MPATTEIQKQVWYPCGHSRVVTVGVQGWNRCPKCGRRCCDWEIHDSPPPAPTAEPDGAGSF